MADEQVADEQVRVLSWGAPPPPARGPRPQYQAVYDDLMAHPGEAGYLGRWPKDGPGAFPSGTFRKRGFTPESRVCADDRTKVDVWATYHPAEPKIPATPES